MGTQEKINYVKEVLKSDVNLAFVGIMICLALVFNWGFLLLLPVGQIIATFLAQLELVQRRIRSRMNLEDKTKIQADLTKIVQSLPPKYQSDFNSVRGLCEEIERRSAELDASGSNTMLSKIVEKLA
jgi:biopolymer transport protein ExbB/TolQ